MRSPVNPFPGEGSAPPWLVFLSAVEYDHPNWTNKQQLASRFAAAGYPVLYAEPLLSPLTLLKDPALRARRWARLFSSRLLSPEEKVPLWRWQPRLVLPFGMKLGWVNYINSIYQARALGKALRQAAGGFPRELVFINYLPSQAATLARLKKKFPGARFIYDCVDDYTTFPGSWPGRVLAEEARLATLCDRVSVSAPALLDRFQAVKEKLVLNTNVADYPLMVTARKSETPTWAPLREVQPRPPAAPLKVEEQAAALKWVWPHKDHRERGVATDVPVTAVFVGTLNFKLDPDILARCLVDHPGVLFVLAGPAPEDWQSPLLARLPDGKLPPNLRVLPALSYRDLPSLFKTCHIGLIPYKNNRHLAGVFPMKFFEYMGAGLSVVSRDLPALRPFAKEFSGREILAPDAENFSRLVGQQAGWWQRPPGTDNPLEDLLETQNRLAAANTWEKRMSLLLGN